MSRGEKLRADLRKGRSFGPADEVLIEEACRIADRLDRLEAILSGDMAEWTSLEWRTGQLTKLVIDDVLGEARQQANTLRQIFHTLKLLGIEVEDVKSDGVDDLGAKRAERRAAAQAQ